MPGPAEGGYADAPKNERAQRIERERRPVEGARGEQVVEGLPGHLLSAQQVRPVLGEERLAVGASGAVDVPGGDPERWDGHRVSSTSIWMRQWGSSDLGGVVGQNGSGGSCQVVPVAGS